MSDTEEDIVFDKNVPIPEPIVRSKYHFDRMEVGDSKFWPGTRAVKAVEAFSRKSDKKFAVRRTTEGGVSGVRIWRTV